MTKPPPFPAIHTAANARAERLGSEAAELRAHADALLSAIDDLCGSTEPVQDAPTPLRRRTGHHAAA
jgi:hypothetical protein